MLERQIQRQIQLRFGALPWLRLWRVNVGAARTPDGAMIRFGIPGMADLTGIVACGRRLEVEVKAAKGRLTPQQVAWGRCISALGGLHLVARSVEDVEAFLAAHRAACTTCAAAAEAQ